MVLNLALRTLTLGSAAILAVTSAALAIAVIAIIRSDLWFYNGWWFSQSWLYDTSTESCYMSTQDVSANLCSYGYVTAGVCIFLAAFSFFMQITKLRVATGYVYALDLGVNLFGVIWWLPFAVTSTVYGKRATDAGLPLESQRHAVWGISWANFSIYVVTASIAVWAYINARRATQPPPQPVYTSAQGQGIPYGSQPPPSYGSGPPPYQQTPPPPMGYAVGDDYAYGNPVYGAPVDSGYAKPGQSTRV